MNRIIFIVFIGLFLSACDIYRTIDQINSHKVIRKAVAIDIHEEIMNKGRIADFPVF